jgi:alpha-beta hydrolase superfamily lysophospholipase
MPAIMRVRSILISTALVVLAVPTAIIGVDTFARWSPQPSSIIAPVAAVPDLDAYLAAREDSVAGVKPTARKEIRWHDVEHKSRTPIAIVYLHGFSATRSELSPVVERLADSLGANAFFTRLAAHGRVDGEAFRSVTPQQWIDDAREALAIGKRLGDRVIVIGTSTGAILAMQLAAESHDSAAPAALVLISPNHEPVDRRARFIAGPFGPFLARTIGGPYYGFKPANAAQAELWTTRYRSEGVAALMDLVLFGQTIDVSRITVPLLTLYTHADDVVRVDLIRSRHAAFGSRSKWIIDVPEATNHVLAGDAMGPRAVTPVVNSMLTFLRRTG